MKLILNTVGCTQIHLVCGTTIRSSHNTEDRLLNGDTLKDTPITHHPKMSPFPAIFENFVAPTHIILDLLMLLHCICVMTKGTQ